MISALSFRYDIGLQIGTSGGISDVCAKQVFYIHQQ